MRSMSPPKSKEVHCVSFLQIGGARWNNRFFFFFFLSLSWMLLEVFLRWKPPEFLWDLSPSLWHTLVLSMCLPSSYFLFTHSSKSYHQCNRPARCSVEWKVDQGPRGLDHGIVVDNWHSLEVGQWRCKLSCWLVAHCFWWPLLMGKEGKNIHQVNSCLPDCQEIGWFALAKEPQLEQHL